MTKKIVFYSLLFLFLSLIFSRSVYAHHRKQVLGDSTNPSATPQIPPTTEGPGLILPDSPLFFLDELKQNARLFFAFSPEDKAKIHTAIAGERLAELRLMLLKNNQEGIATDIRGVSSNLKETADNISQAGLTGRNISQLAKEINASIKRKQEMLDILEKESAGELKALVVSAQSSILESKVKVEDSLPENELENEIRDDLNRQVEKRVHDASESAREMLEDLNELKKEASKSAEKALHRREEALKEAIEKRNEALKKVAEKLLENERKRQDKLLKVQEKVAGEAREAVKKAQEAARKFQKAQEEVNRVQQQSVGGTSGTTVSTGGSSSGSSSSGSSGGGDHGGSSGSEDKSGGGDHGGKD